MRLILTYYSPAARLRRWLRGREGGREERGEEGQGLGRRILFSRKGVEDGKEEEEEEREEEEDGEEEDWLLQADLVQSLRVRMDELFASLGYGEEREGGREGGVGGEGMMMVVGDQKKAMTKEGRRPLRGAYLLYYDLPSLPSSSSSSLPSSSSSSSSSTEEEKAERRRKAMRDLPALRAQAAHVPLASLLRRVRESVPE